MTETVDKTIEQLQVGDVIVGRRNTDGSAHSFFGSWTVIGNPRVAADLIPIKSDDYRYQQDYQTYPGAIFRVKKEDKNVATIDFTSKGKHGTITNSAGQKLVGTVYWASDFSEEFHFKIDNSTHSTEFFKAEWTFEADRVPVPTTPLTVVKAGDKRFVRVGAGWYDQAERYYWTTDVQRLADDKGFTVLYQGE